MQLGMIGLGRMGANMVRRLLPAGHDADRVRKIILENFDMSLGTGLNKIKGKVFRIGHFGYFSQLDILRGLAALEMTLERLGYPVKLGAAVAVTSTTERIHERVAELVASGLTASGHLADLTAHDVSFDASGTRLYLHRKDETAWRPGTVVYLEVADIQAAQEAFWPPYQEVMSRIGRERGWPPLSRAQFESMTADLLDQMELRFQPVDGFFTGFEGDIYRKVYRLVKDNLALIKNAKPTTSKNSAGYLLWEIWRFVKPALKPTELKHTRGIILWVSLSREWSLSY